MANHLNLTHTLLEIDNQRHLRIYQRGKYAHLRPSEVRQFTSWLHTKHVDQLKTDHNNFKYSSSRVYINTFITIPSTEAEKVHAWLCHLKFNIR
jgi:hypothetical protein